jgi:preprotein translocase subunit SecF
MEFFSRTPNFDFLGKRFYFFALSALLIAGTIYLWFSQGDRKFGVDFLGGHEFVVQFDTQVDNETIRKALSEGGIEDPLVQGFEAESRQYAIRIRDTGDTRAVVQRVKDALKPSFGEKVEVIRTDFVGPTVGEELRRKALIAVAIGLIGILLYVSFRFEFAFAFGAVVAVFHDVIVSLGAVLFFNYPINMATLAAALTIVGYSVNDTIVIFDRVREELGRSRGEQLSSLVNRSLNATLSRTLITQGLTTVSILSLLILGGGAIRDLSLFLFAGMIAGTYSTIYIASPVMIAWHKFRGGTEEV